MPGRSGDEHEAAPQLGEIRHAGGQARALSKDGISKGMRRRAAATESRCRKALTRKRARPGTAQEKS